MIDFSHFHMGQSCQPGLFVMSLSPDPTLLISIINYRTGTLTVNCIRSVLADIEDVPAQIVVIDNLSGDGSAEQIEEWIASQPAPVPVTLIRSTTNAGFSGGHNQGIKVSPADFYLILNSDALIRPGFFAAMLEAAKRAPTHGFFAPRLEYEDSTQQVSCFRFPSPFSELIRGAATGPVTKALSRYDIPLTMPPESEEIGWASFACILLRGAMVNDIGLMDEGYFLYFEDTEYCWRAHRAGWRIAYVPNARTVHFRGGSAPVKALAREKKRLPAYYYASRSRFFHQAYGWHGLIAANALWHIGRGIAQLRQLLGKPVPPTNHNERRDIWINAMRPLGDSHATRLSDDFT